MTDEELLGALERKRRALLKAISRDNLDLSSNEILRYSQELDELIVSYMNIETEKTENN